MRHYNARVGEKNGHAKLSPAEVAEIREEVLQGVRQADVALKYGVSQQQVSRIYSAQSWSHIPFPKGVVSSETRDMLSLPTRQTTHNSPSSASKNFRRE